MEERRVWNREETLFLIENFELYPEVWNVHCKDFKNRVKKQGAFQKLAELFSTSEQEIQRKLHNLRTQLNHEWRKVQKKKSGQGTNELYKSTWEFFDSLKFILAANAHSSTEDNLVERENNLAVDMQSSTVDEEEIIEKETKSDSSKRNKKRNCKTTEDDAILAKAIKVMDRPLDNFQIFGDYVASELRSLPSEQLQRKLKRMIQKSIMEISELYDETQSGTSTPASITLLSPSYETSSSNASQLTMQSFKTYEYNPEPLQLQHNTQEQSLRPYIQEFGIDT